ncbi:MAG: response regulator transcription factor [Thermoleophilia bacterium]|nr:response regulator transcription factor [Thermoleophilia bacterium]
MTESTNKIKVVIADDHAILRSGLVRLLEEKGGIEVIGEAEDGSEAIRQTRELQPDVVLMDIGMPVMNGLEATKEIKKRARNVQILVLTVHDNEEYLLHAFRAGAAGFIPKKAAHSDLVDAIKVVARGEYFLYPSVTRMLIENLLDKPAPRRHEPARKIDSLTEREREILKLVAEGYTCREIAESLYISVKTVETHKSHVMDKLGLRKRADLVHYAINKGILQVDLVEAFE